MLNTGPTRDELAELERAARAGDDEALFAAYESINARLGVPPGTSPAWAMRLIADGCVGGLARLAGDEHFAAVPIHAETIAAADAEISEVVA